MICIIVDQYYRVRRHGHEESDEAFFGHSLSDLLPTKGDVNQDNICLLLSDFTTPPDPCGPVFDCSLRSVGRFSHLERGP